MELVSSVKNVVLVDKQTGMEMKNAWLFQRHCEDILTRNF